MGWGWWFSLSQWLAGRVSAQQMVQWPAYGSDLGATKYSTAADINRSNVARLAVAWEWATGETPNAEFKARPGSFEGTPLMINDTLYVSTSYNRVVALDAGTGRLLWSCDPKPYTFGRWRRTERGSCTAGWRRGPTARVGACSSTVDGG